MMTESSHPKVTIEALSVIEGRHHRNIHNSFKLGCLSKVSVVFFKVNKIKVRNKIRKGLNNGKPFW